MNTGLEFRERRIEVNLITFRRSSWLSACLRKRYHSDDVPESRARNVCGIGCAFIVVTTRVVWAAVVVAPIIAIVVSFRCLYGSVTESERTGIFNIGKVVIVIVVPDCIDHQSYACG